MTSRRPIRVFIVDHHDIVREGLASILGRVERLTVVGHCATIEVARSRITEVRPDVLVASAVLPDGLGIELFDAVTRAGCDLKLVLLDLPRSVGRIEGVEQVLSKARDPDLLVGAIRDLVDDPAKSVAEQDGSHLPPHLRRILAPLAEGRSVREISTYLGLSVHTVRSYLRKLYAAMGTRTRAQTVAVAIRRGLV